MNNIGTINFHLWFLNLTECLGGNRSKSLKIIKGVKRTCQNQPQNDKRMIIFGLMLACVFAV